MRCVLKTREISKAFYLDGWGKKYTTNKQNLLFAVLNSENTENINNMQK